MKYFYQFHIMGRVYTVVEYDSGLKFVGWAKPGDPTPMHLMDAQ